MVMMNDGHLSRILKISQEKGATPERWTNVLASPIFAALLDARADLSDPNAVLAALKLPVKKRKAPRKVLAGLLELCGEAVPVPAHDPFVVRDKFVINRNGELPISDIGEAFKTNFLGRVELNVKAATLKQRKLLKSSVDAPILSALGGIEKATIRLANVFEFLKTADHLKMFIFYITDNDRVVYAYWDDHGWYIDAYSVTDPGAWDGDRLVVLVVSR